MTISHGTIQKDVNNPTTVFKKIEEYCNPTKNEVAESHKF